MVEYIAPIVMTCIWGFIGLICPFFAKGPNRGIIQWSLVLTAVSCWLFWLCCYMSQMNPLIGPRLSKNELLIIAKEWGSGINSESKLINMTN